MTERWARERAERSLAQMSDWIARHDNRSAALMGITVAMMGTMSIATPAVHRWSAEFLLAAGLAAAGFATILYQLLRGQMPRMRGDQPSLSFFGTVAAMPQEEYRARFIGMNEDEYLDDVLRQCYVNARILRSKFRCLTRALIALLATAVPWACAISLAKSL